MPTAMSSRGEEVWACLKSVPWFWGSDLEAICNFFYSIKLHGTNDYDVSFEDSWSPFLELQGKILFSIHSPAY